jgi:hypothetical protein
MFLSLCLNESTATFSGRANTFRTPGRAGTSGQKLFALFNAAGSTTTVLLTSVHVELYQTVVKAVTVAPPVIRVHRITALPTQGTSLAKVPKNTDLSSHVNITCHGDASADGTSSAQALSVTPPAGHLLEQSFAPRMITAAGYYAFDRIEFFKQSVARLFPGSGCVVELAYTAAGSNPTTDQWIVTADWEELPR